MKRMRASLLVCFAGLQIFKACMWLVVVLKRCVAASFCVCVTGLVDSILADMCSAVAFGGARVVV